MSLFEFKLQGTELNLITFEDTLRSFIAKLQNWRRKVNLGNIAMFEKVSDLHGSEIDPAEQLKLKILQHLHALEEELNRSFRIFWMKKKLHIWSETLLLLILNISKVSDDFQDELLEIRNDSFAHDLFVKKSLSQFQVSM